MKLEMQILAIWNSFENMDYGSTKELVKNLYAENEEAEVSKALAFLISSNYSISKAGYLAKLLEIIIQDNPVHAIYEQPSNTFFILCLATGSKDLYECYIEEGVQKFLKNVSIDEHEVHYMELLGFAQKYQKEVLPQFNPYIKGMHYNGFFDRDNDKVMIQSEDYVVLEAIATKYNILVGMNKIISDLYDKSGFNIGGD